MPDDTASQIEKLRQAIAALEALGPAYAAQVAALKEELHQQLTLQAGRDTLISLPGSSARRIGKYF